MAEWKKVVVSGSSAELEGLTVDNTITGDITGNAGGNAATATQLATARDIGGVSFDGTANINLPGVNSAGNQDTSGNAATVTTNAALTGDVTSDGTSNATTIANDAVTTAKILNANVTNAKLQHDGLMLGTTDVSLGATGSSLAGLTLTGAVGSGSFSGSFQGDGSLLTGIPDATDAKFLVYTTGSGTNSIVGTAGGGNVASGTLSTVGGGKDNTASGGCSTIGGGMFNTASRSNGVVGGGCKNRNQGTNSTIAGGASNCVENGAIGSTIAGGTANKVCFTMFSGIFNGTGNTNSGYGSTIVGGESNCISGACSGILGGKDNTANTAKSFIVGSDISSTVACHTHVNNLTTAGSITGSNICGTGRVQGATMGAVDGSSTITGSFVGDGSSLTGLPAAAIDTYSGGVDNRIITAVNGTSVQGEGNLTFDGSTLAVTGNATISTDLTVSRNLIVQGTASFQSTEDLDIKDRFIRMASGSTSAGDGGIVIQQTGPLNGEVFGFDSTAGRFGLSGSFDASQNSFSPDAFVSAVVVGGSGETKTDVVGRYQKPGNIFVQEDGEIHIYV